MKAHYIFRFSQALKPDDHWLIELGGTRFELLVDDDGLATGLKATLSGLPPSTAPSVTPIENGPAKLHINVDDPHRPFVERKIRRAFAYVQCFENVEIDFSNVEVEYAAESEDERAQMDAFGMRMHRNRGPNRLTWNYITRALAAPDSGDDPEFAATLLASARDAYFAHKYITSFRFAFLMFDGLFGNGMFKKKALEEAFSSSALFVAAVRKGLNDTINQSFRHRSPTSDLLKTGPSVEDVMRHLIERRGHYFHSNRRKPDAWRPEREEEAEALATLSIHIASAVGAEVAMPMFEADLGKKHFDMAEAGGYTVPLVVTFKYTGEDESFVRTKEIKYNVPGTAPSAKMAASTAQQFLPWFEYNLPADTLRSAKCVDESTGQTVWSFEVSDELFENDK